MRNTQPFILSKTQFWVNLPQRRRLLQVGTVQRPAERISALNFLWLTDPHDLHGMPIPSPPIPPRSEESASVERAPWTRSPAERNPIIGSV